MTGTLRELCNLIESCVLNLEQELRHNIETCRKNILTNKFTDTKLALEKAKDYHNKEIITILSGIITNIKQIVHHEGKIRRLNEKESLSEEDLKRYSYVKRQVSVFSGGDGVTRRELRRTASTNSVNSLNAWVAFLNNEEHTNNVIYASSSLPDISTVTKRKSPNSKRKQKKLISSTFENILEDEDQSFKLMDVLSEETSNDTNVLRSNLSNALEDKDRSSKLMNVLSEETSNDTNELSSDLSNALEDTNCDMTPETDDVLYYINSIKTIVQKQEISDETESQFSETASIFNDCLEMLEAEIESPVHQEVDTKPKIVGVVMKKNVKLDAM